MRREYGGLMATLLAQGAIVSPGKRKTKNFAMKMAAFTGILAVAIGFVWKYVFRYYLNYRETAFTDPVAGAANYWAMRGWLMMHITGGMLALLTGPWQFWTGFRRNYARVHRWMGRIFLIGVAVGSIGAFRLIFGTMFGWAFGFSLFGLVLAWMTTTSMAYFAILRGNVAVHKEWMVRAYVVTFAFVTFRLFNDYGPTSRLQPAGDRGVTLGWACWAIPLLVTEVALQLRRMRTVVKPS
jgi:uncharacterized membrane protein YozB (DUF420 family)